MRIAHLSDFHFTKLTFNPLRLFPKRIFGQLHWLKSRKSRFSQTALEALPDYLKTLGVDLTLFGGDFTSSAMHEEFHQAMQWAKQFKPPIISIPGNHDCYTFRSHFKKHYYQYFKNSTATSLSLEHDDVEAHHILPTWWLIAINTARPSLLDSSGLFSKKAEKNVLTLLKQIPQNHKIIFFTHYPLFQQEGKRRGLERAEALQAIVQETPNIALYLHGHTHRTSIADLRGSGYPICVDSGSCSDQISTTFHLIDLEKNHCQIETHFWKEGWKQKEKREFSWS